MKLRGRSQERPRRRRGSSDTDPDRRSASPPPAPALPHRLQPSPPPPDLLSPAFSPTRRGRSPVPGTAPKADDDRDSGFDSSPLKVLQPAHAASQGWEMSHLAAAS